MNVYDIHRRKRHSRWKGGSSYTSSEFFLSRLTDKQRLDGHRGCVNRLAWHEEGRYLASVSDDRRCLIWDFHSSSASSSSSLTPPQSSPSRTLNGGDQFGHMNPSAVIYTGHAFNIFGVGFLGDTHVATGAMDREVRLSCIRDETFSMVCHCHNGRVKHIATLPRSSQHLWWSASEDGTVRQYDKRVPHICGGSRQLQAANVLISLRPSYSYSSRPAFRISPFSRLSASSGGGDAGATPTDAGATRARAPSSGDSNRRHRRERTDTNRSTSFSSSSSRHRQSGRAGEQSGGSLLASRREEDEESGVGSLARQREDRRASQSDFSSERDRGRERDKERRKKEVEDNREDEDRQGEEAERRWGTRRRRTTSSSSSPALERRGSSDMNEDVSAGGGGGQSSLDIRRDRRRRRGKYDREEDRGMFPSSAEGHRRGEEQEEVQRQGRRLSIRGRRYEVYNTIDRRLNLGSERSILTRDLRLLREAYYETQWNPKAALSRGEPQVKAVSINPLRPEYMAIAANDPLIRVYDRRMLSLHTNQPQRSAFSSSSSMPRPSASSSSLSPHHAPDANSNESPPTSRGRSHFLFSAEARGGRRDLRESMPCDVFLPSTFWSVPFEYTPEWQSRFSRLLAATHCCWSPDGRTLAATYSGEQVYTFPFLSATELACFPKPLPSYTWKKKRLRTHQGYRGEKTVSQTGRERLNAFSSSSSSSSSALKGKSLFSSREKLPFGEKGEEEEKEMDEAKGAGGGRTRRRRREGKRREEEKDKTDEYGEEKERRGGRRRERRSRGMESPDRRQGKRDVRREEDERGHVVKKNASGVKKDEENESHSSRSGPRDEGGEIEKEKKKKKKERGLSTLSSSSSLVVPSPFFTSLTASHFSSSSSSLSLPSSSPSLLISPSVLSSFPDLSLLPSPSSLPSLSSSSSSFLSFPPRVSPLSPCREEEVTSTTTPQSSSSTLIYGEEESVKKEEKRNAIKNSLSSGKDKEEVLRIQRYACAGILSYQERRSVMKSSSASSSRGPASELAIKDLQISANQLIGEERYGEAIVLLTRALRQTSDPQLRVPLLCNRAHALIKRAARGDDLAAEKDAIEAAYLIPSNPKTHYRRIQALRATRRPFAAFRLARACKKKFPGVPDFTRVMREIARDVCQSEGRTHMFGGSGIRTFPSLISPSPPGSPLFSTRPSEDEEEKEQRERRRDQEEERQKCRFSSSSSFSSSHPLPLKGVQPKAGESERGRCSPEKDGEGQYARQGGSYPSDRQDPARRRIDFSSSTSHVSSSSSLAMRDRPPTSLSSPPHQSSTSFSSSSSPPPSLLFSSSTSPSSSLISSSFSSSSYLPLYTASSPPASSASSPASPSFAGETVHLLQPHPTSLSSSSCSASLSSSSPPFVSVSDWPNSHQPKGPRRDEEEESKGHHSGRKASDEELSNHVVFGGSLKAFEKKEGQGDEEQEGLIKVSSLSPGNTNKQEDRDQEDCQKKKKKRDTSEKRSEIRASLQKKQVSSPYSREENEDKKEDHRSALQDQENLLSPHQPYQKIKNDFSTAEEPSPPPGAPDVAYALPSREQTSPSPFSRKRSPGHLYTPPPSPATIIGLSNFQASTTSVGAAPSSSFSSSSSCSSSSSSSSLTSAPPSIHQDNRIDSPQQRRNEDLPSTQPLAGIGGSSSSSSSLLCRQIGEKEEEGVSFPSASALSSHQRLSPAAPQLAPLSQDCSASASCERMSTSIPGNTRPDGSPEKQISTIPCSRPSEGHDSSLRKEESPSSSSLGGIEGLNNLSSTTTTGRDSDRVDRPSQPPTTPPVTAVEVPSSSSSSSSSLTASVSGFSSHHQGEARSCSITPPLGSPSPSISSSSSSFTLSEPTREGGGRRGWNVRQMEKKESEEILEMERILYVLSKWIEHSEEASKPLWVHPAIGHSFRSTIPDWQGWPPFTFVRRLVRNKLRRWFDERRKRRDIYEDDHTSREIRHERGRKEEEENRKKERKEEAKARDAEAVTEKDEEKEEKTRKKKDGDHGHENDEDSIDTSSSSSGRRRQRKRAKEGLDEDRVRRDREKKIGIDHLSPFNANSRPPGDNPTSGRRRHTEERERSSLERDGEEEKKNKKENSISPHQGEKKERDEGGEEKEEIRQHQQKDEEEKSRIEGLVQASREHLSAMRDEAKEESGDPFHYKNVHNRSHGKHNYGSSRSRRSGYAFIVEEEMSFKEINPSLPPFPHSLETQELNHDTMRLKSSEEDTPADPDSSEKETRRRRVFKRLRDRSFSSSSSAFSTKGPEGDEGDSTRNDAANQPSRIPPSSPKSSLTHDERQEEEEKEMTEKKEKEKSIRKKDVDGQQREEKEEKTKYKKKKKNGNKKHAASLLMSSKTSLSDKSTDIHSDYRSENNRRRRRRRRNSQYSPTSISSSSAYLRDSSPSSSSSSSTDQDLLFLTRDCDTDTAVEEYAALCSDGGDLSEGRNKKREETEETAGTGRREGETAASLDEASRERRPRHGSRTVSSGNSHRRRGRSLISGGSTHLNRRSGEEEEQREERSSDTRTREGRSDDREAGTHALRQSPTQGGDEEEEGRRRSGGGEGEEQERREAHGSIAVAVDILPFPGEILEFSMAPGGLFEAEEDEEVERRRRRADAGRRSNTRRFEEGDQDHTTSPHVTHRHCDRGTMEGRSNEEGFSSDLHEWMDANSYDTNRPSERDDNEGERRRRTDGGSGRTRRRGGRRRRSLHFSSNDEMSNDEGMSLRAGEDKISSSLSARQGKERRRRTRRRRFLSSSDSSWPSFHTSDPLTTTPTHSSSSLSLSDPDDSQDDVSSSGGFSQSDEEARERREDPGEDSGDSTYPNNEEAQSSGRDTDGEDEEEIPPGPLRGVGALATADEAEEYLLNANWLPLPENGRFVGHCSAATDIKEVAFWGNDHILAGSDDGSVLVWRASDGSIVNILRGHESHVNCVAVHPSLGGGGGSCCVATSGIDDYIKIWSPTADEPFVMDDNARRILKQIQNLVEEETSSTRTFLTGVGPQVLRHFLGVMNRRRQQGGAPGGDTGEEQQAFCNVQ